MREKFDLLALYETSTLLNDSLEIGFILDNLLRTAMSKLLVTRSIALLSHPVHQVYTIASAQGIYQINKTETFDFDLFPIPVPGLSEAPAILKKWGIHSLIPLTARKQHLGFVGFGHKVTKQPFLPEEASFVQSLVHMSSVAVHNASMVGELQTANQDLALKIQQLNTLFDLAAGFGATQGKEHVLKQLGFSLMGHLMIRQFALLLKDHTADNPPNFTPAIAKGLNMALQDSEIKALSGLKELVLLPNTIPQWQPFSAMGLRLILPLRIQNETRGVLCIGDKTSQLPYTQTDLEFMTALGQLTLTSLENASLLATRLENERLEEEMRLASNIQRRLLPQKLPSIPYWSVDVWSQPARHVGGDFFDVRPLDEHRFLIAIADVTGKGIPAALLMSHLQAGIQFQLATHALSDLAQATAMLNAVITDNTDSDKFITFFWGILDLRDQTFVFVNAGHDAPVWFRTGREVLRLETGGPLLGVLKHVPYEQGRIRLQSGDRLFFFTDGLSEALNPNHEEMGVQRLVQTLVAVHTPHAAKTLSMIKDEVLQWTDTAPQSDDRTAIVLQAETF
ncbi:MAG TPA: SpoIIE family protein phosphatase [Rhodothermales bacterium]|nr:SpoIIE family protein phosphatase [Rhodothermales bacterium]